MNTATTTTTTRLRIAFAATIAAAALCAAPRAVGETLRYEAGSGGTHSWDDTSAWKKHSDGSVYGSMPTAADTVWLNSDTIADPTPLRITSGTAAAAGTLIICTNAGGKNPAVQLEDGGSLQVSGTVATNFCIGNGTGSTGIFRMNGGTVSSGGPMTIGGNGRGEVFLNGGTVNSSVVQLGYMSGKGDGYMEIDGGTVNGQLKIGFNVNTSGEVVFKSGTIASGKLATIGEAGVGRFVFDGGVHKVEGDVWDFKIGDQATSRGELVLLKEGLTFGSGRKLFVGYHGTGVAETYVPLTVGKLKIGGSTTYCSLMSAIGTNLVVKADTSCEIGGYEPYENNTTGWAGNGELVVSNATLFLNGSVPADTAAQLYIGRYEGGFGKLRGWGTVRGSTWSSFRIIVGEGQIVGDGFGEEQELKVNALSVRCMTNGVVRANAPDSMNGWFAVNRGAVFYPWAKFNAASAEGYLGAFGDAGSPDLVNSAKFSVSGTETSDTYFRGGVFASDRTDLNLDKLPENRGVVGVWRFGLFTSTGLSKAKTFESVALDLRYDQSKLSTGRRYSLCRWDGSAWRSVASGKAAANHVVSVSGLAPVSDQDFNVGTFALLWARDPFYILVR